MTAGNTSLRHPIALVAGGTGGHVFPAEALAAELRLRGYTLAFFTDRRGAAWPGTLGEVATHSIRTGQVANGAALDRVRGAAELAIGALQSRRLLRRLGPSVVVGFGGYASVPTMMAAVALRVPTVIHEQNALLGRANRLLAPRVTAIATSFPEIARLRPANAPKVVHTGNPVREAVRRLRDRAYARPGRGGPIRVLVTGGSQAASVFARVLPDALGRLPAELGARLRLSQQCRAEDLERVRAAYRERGIRAETAPFFEDLAERLGAAHLVIARAGASTCAELTAAGRPAILVPYPHAADDHQSANAAALAAAGGAEPMAEPDFTPDTLAARLKLLLDQPARLAAMAGAARHAGHRDAAGNLAILVTRLIAGDGADGGEKEAA